MPRRVTAPLLPVLAAALVLTACSSEPGVSGSSAEPSETGATTATSPSSTDAAATVPPATDDTTATTTAPPDDGPEIEWEEYDEGLEIGTLEVPLDHDDPDGATFELFLGRSLARDPDRRIGTLLVNPGGPGFGGSQYGLFAGSIFDDELLDRFDIVGWDPRGTGESVPAVDCVEDYDRYYAELDITPDDATERQQNVDLAREFADECAEQSGDILGHIGTNDTARDMDAIRRALGEDQISYFGFSYGSELGATWATLFPETVRAAVLDGAADPNADFTESSLQQVRGFEASIATFLAQCSDDPDCAFHNGGDAEGAFDALMLQIDENPVPSEPGRPDVTRGVALTGVAQAMYSETLWDELEQALADAQAGDGSGLLALYDQYFVRNEDGTYDNSLEAFQSISCMDTPERPTVEEEDAEAPLFNEAAPRFAPGTTGGYFCTFFPESIDPRIAITGAGAGPILVVGTTGDPATPLASTENMAETLEEGVLLVIEADQHTGYGVNECSYETIDSYLVDLEVPADGFVCES